MAVNVKMGVDIGGFTAGIKQGQQILKGLNAEMKATDAEFKATGNAEQKMTQQTKTLNSQLNVQKGIFTQAQQALKKMEEAGIKPTDAAYQKMYATMMNAKAGMNEAQAALNSLGTGAESAAAKANKLTDSVQGISKKMSLEQVINGVNAIKTGLETAAQKAVQLGEDLWDAIMNKAKWADDTATMAQMYGIDIETFERMQKLVTNGLDTSVDAMLRSQQKLRKGIGADSQAVMNVLDELHIRSKELAGDEGVGEYVTRDQTELFWEAGRALMEMSDAYDKEAAAQTLFGKSWQELIPLFTQFKTYDEYKKALEEVNVVSEEDVNALTELNEAVAKLKGDLDTLATEMLAKLAPALTDAANALNGVLESVLEYLETEEGKQMLNDLGTAVSGLFDDLGKIDPEKVVSGFAEVFTKITGGVQWVVENLPEAEAALGTIVTAWGAITIGGNLLKIVNFVNGITGLAGGSAAADAAAAGTAVGTSWGGAFAAAVLAAAPWLVALVVKNAVPEDHQLGNVARIEAAETTSEEIAMLKEWVTLQNELKTMNEQMFVDPAFDEQKYLEAEQRVAELGNTLIGGDLWNRFWDYIAYNDMMPGKSEIPTDFLDKMLEEQKIEVVPTVPENADQIIAADVGTVLIPAELVLNGISGGGTMGMFRGMPTGGAGGGGLPHYKKGNANGLPYVPNDGLYLLHRGERVTPTRELASRNFSSNLYVENMNMSGGMDAAGLAAAMAAAQRRAMAAYGS